MRSGALVAGCASALALAAGSAGAADGEPVPTAAPAAASILLGTSRRQLVQPIEQGKADQVRRALDLDLSFGHHGRYLTEEELRIVLGGGRVSLNGSDRALETVEIRAPQPVHESPREVSVPFGLAGIVWGVRHPTQAWRLLLPVID